ncbi:MAG: hypothetical protein AB1340_06920 [Pseudomonadota bacterium]
MDHRIAGMDENEGSFASAVKVMDKIRQTMGDRYFLLGHGNHGHARLAEQAELYSIIWNGVNEGLSVAKAKIMANPCMQGYGKTTPLDENSLGRWVSFAYLEAEAASF